MPTPSVSPWRPMMLPSLSSSLAALELFWRSCRVPAAASTDGSELTFSSSEASTVARPPEENSTSCLPLMTASVPS